MSTIPANRRNIQSEKGDGFLGDTFEASVKAIFGQEALVSRGRSFDLVLNKKRYEVKTGAGELGRVTGKACAGVSAILYCPVYNPKLSLNRQEAFVLSRTDFLDIIKKVGLYRESKATTNGRTNVHAIQTFWNHSKNAPHGKKYYALLDELYNSEALTIAEFIEQNLPK